MGVALLTKHVMNSPKGNNSKIRNAVLTVHFIVKAV